jgi:hypothetical protein
MKETESAVDNSSGSLANLFFTWIAPMVEVLLLHSALFALIFVLCCLLFLLNFFV